MAAQAWTGLRGELNEYLEELQRVQPEHLAMANRLEVAGAMPQFGRAAVRGEDAQGVGIG
jgi:hypothetical protein